ncbi:MAG TPA: hypothetical protein DCF33_13510, partial [Saprospirales bacterium]|nr:hypothetical protein [Saprospirales bacterium]
EKIQIESLIDDRMFTICWAGNDAWSKSLNTANYDDPKSEQAKLWHRVIFLDGKSPGLANDQLLRNLNQNNTTPRTADYGTLFGITRYSFVALTDEELGKNLVLPHLQSMYFQIALLSLLQRASILRFSEKITEIAANPDQKGYLEKSKALYMQYLHFVNKIYFREVTPQEQGIELYRMMQEKMDIPRDIDTLKQEIAEFHQLLDLENESRQTKAMNTLTIVGSALLAPSLILSYFGLSSFPELPKDQYCAFTAMAAFVAFLGSISALFTAYGWVQNWKKHILISLLICTILIFIWAINLPFIYLKE